MSKFVPLRYLSDIPNQEGFRLEALEKSTGLRIQLQVKKDAEGCHYLATLGGARCEVGSFSGWYPPQSSGGMPPGSP